MYIYICFLEDVGGTLFTKRTKSINYETNKRKMITY